MGSFGGEQVSDDMKFDIRHGTGYCYPRPVALQPHRLMLYSRDSHGLRVLATSLHCTSPAELSWTQHVLGNLTATANFADGRRTRYHQRGER